MSCGFLRLPAELRISIYEMLVPEQVIVGQRMFESDRTRWPGHSLLFINRMIHEEASAAFYGRCTFSFRSCGSETASRAQGPCWHLEPFLSQIGRNATHIRTIALTFPYVVAHHDDQEKVSDDSAHTLAILSKHCSNVRTIHTPLCYTRYAVESRYSPAVTEAALDALVQVNDLFRGFKAVEKIIVVHYYNAGRRDELLRRIAPFGWIMVGTPPPIWDPEDPPYYCGSYPYYSEDDESD